MKEYKFYAVTNDNIKISCLYIQPSNNYIGKVALLLHGFSSGMNNSTNLAIQPKLLKFGLGILKFDFRGCGGSEGVLGKTTISSGVLDLNSCIKAFFENFSQHNKPDFIFIGSSFGGAVGLAAAKTILPIAVVLKSPVLDIYGGQEIRRGIQGMEEWKKNGYVIIKSKAGDVKLEFSYAEDSLNYNFFDKAMIPEKVSVSIVHGVKDEIAPFFFTEKFVKGNNKTSLLRIEEANHHYNEDNHFEIMINFIIREIEKYIRESKK